MIGKFHSNISNNSDVMPPPTPKARGAVKPGTTNDDNINTKQILDVHQCEEHQINDNRCPMS